MSSSDFTPPLSLAAITVVLTEEPAFALTQRQHRPKPLLLPEHPVSLPPQGTIREPSQRQAARPNLFFKSALGLPPRRLANKLSFKALRVPSHPLPKAKISPSGKTLFQLLDLQPTTQGEGGGATEKTTSHVAPSS